MITTSITSTSTALGQAGVVSRQDRPVNVCPKHRTTEYVQYPKHESGAIGCGHRRRQLSILYRRGRGRLKRAVYAIYLLVYPPPPPDNIVNTPLAKRGVVIGVYQISTSVALDYCQRWGSATFHSTTTFRRLLRTGALPTFRREKQNTHRWWESNPRSERTNMDVSLIGQRRHAITQVA